MLPLLLRTAAVCLISISTVRCQFGGTDIFGNNNQNNQFPQSPANGQSQFGAGGINSNQDGQGSIFTGFEGRGPGQQASIRQQLRFTDPDFDWESYDRRADDQWWHLYGFGERFHDLDISSRPGGRPWLDQQIDLDFFMPFYGFRFNYSFIFPEGFVSFSYPHYIQPPYTYPSPNWPQTPDPSFIAAFMTDQTFMSIGEHRISHVWYRILSRPPNMIGRPVDQNRRPAENNNNFGVDGIFTGRTYNGQLLRTQEGRIEDPAFLDQLSIDIREGQVGARGFQADYALIVTWERMAYGGSPRYTQLNLYGEVRRWQNTYQMVIATDEVRTFVMYNYANINWTSSTSAGALFGRGGKQSALVGFNGGNGTGFTELPYSAEGNSYKLVQFGSTPIAGRWQARVDEAIIYGGCTNNTIGKLQVQPPYYDMLAGTPINVTGPCFRPTDRLKLQVDTLTIDCVRINIAKAKCLIPVYSLWIQGATEIKLSIDGGKTYPFFSNWYIVAPHRSRNIVKLIDNPVLTDNNWKNPYADRLMLKWNPFNISSNPSARINIELYGYWENTLSQDLRLIGSIGRAIPNTGVYEFKPSELWTKDQDIRNSDRFLRDQAWRQFQGGVVNVRLDEEQWENDMGDLMYWSEAVGFPWYFLPKWQYEYGERNWALQMCIEWFEYDGRRQNFVMELEPQVPCPCKLEQALADFGRFAPYEQCDKDGNSLCYGMNGASHCVISTKFVWTGSAQVCCYEGSGFLMFSDDYEYGDDYLNYYGAGTALRAHPWGTPPFRRPPFLPSMSNFAVDMMPFDMCCAWTDHCELYYWRRPTSGCQLYRQPTIGYTYGLGHFVTFDGTEYNFPGNGFFVLSKLNSPAHDLMAQIRMEVPEKTNWDQFPRATVITGLAASDNSSSKVEVFARKNFRRWRYRTDVYIDGDRYFFDMPFKLLYNFPGVTVRVPLRTTDMGIIEIMFSTGVGIRVQEYKGALSITMSMPPNYNISVPFDYLPAAQRQYAQRPPGDYDDCNKAYQTMGLMGTFNNDPDDDLMGPQPTCQRSTVSRPPTEGQLQSLYTNFGNRWRADGVQFKILFGTYAQPLYNPSLFNNPAKWSPEFVIRPNAEQNIYRDLVFTLDQVKTQCQGVISCIYDYYQTGVREIGIKTLQYEAELASLKSDASTEVISCGPLQKNRGVLKYPQFDNYLDGRTVTFSCQPEFFLHGDTQRTCVNGTWTPGWWPWCRERGFENFLKWMVGLGTSILIILIIAAIFVCCRYRRVSHEKDQGPAQMRYNNYPNPQQTYNPPQQQQQISTPYKSSTPVSDHGLIATLEHAPGGGSAHFQQTGI